MLFYPFVQSPLMLVSPVVPAYWERTNIQQWSHVKIYFLFSTFLLLFLLLFLFYNGVPYKSLFWFSAFRFLLLFSFWLLFSNHPSYCSPPDCWEPLTGHQQWSKNPFLFFGEDLRQQYQYLSFWWKSLALNTLPISRICFKGLASHRYSKTNFHFSW